MHPEESKKFVRALLQRVFNDHQVDVIDPMVSAEYVEVEPYPGHRGNRDGLKEWYQAILDAFPDLQWTVEMQIAEGDRVMTVGQTSGRHKGRFFEVPATDRWVTLPWVLYHRISDGKIVEGRHFPDALAFQQQIGEVPPPGGRRPERS